MNKSDFITHVLDANGYQHQAIKAIEEMAELQQALARYATGEYSVHPQELREHVAEELADVELCMLQVRRMFDIDDFELEQREKTKIDRYLNRESRSLAAKKGG